MMKIMLLILLMSVVGCDNKKGHDHNTEKYNEQDIQTKRIMERIKAEMIYMPAGTFLMGDFCSVMRNDGMFCTSDKNNKPAHKVELTAFSISKYKITHEDYNYYLTVSGLPLQRYVEKSQNDKLASMNMFEKSPAIMSWSEARNYCLWVKKMSGLNFSLPTEAQWEYAARNKGKYILIATDDGTLRYNKKTGLGENYSTEADRESVNIPAGFISALVHFPVDRYPPSPAGLYGMADNGKEWVMDWYDPDWYVKSPLKNPQGPLHGVVIDNETGQYLKVRRGASDPTPGWPSGLTFSRSYQIPEPDFPAGVTARCVANEALPLNAIK